MPRPKLFKTELFPYHITGRSNNKDWFYLPLPEIWSLLTENLGIVSETYQLKIHSFVLMSNHFHLMATTPDSNLGDVMKYFMRESAKSVNRTANRTNHL